MGATPGLDDVGGETKYTWKQFLRVDDLGGIQATLTQIVDGDGVALPLKISTSQVEIDALKVASLSGILKSTSGVVSAITDDSSNWDAAYSHISNDGSDHSFIDQSVISGSTPTLTGTNITGVPAASILAGTFGTGSYTIDTNLTLGGNLQVNGGDIGIAADTNLMQLAVNVLTVNGDVALGSDGTAETELRLYSDAAGKYLRIRSVGSSVQIMNVGGIGFLISSVRQISLDTGITYGIHCNVGTVFEINDINDGNATRFSLALATGALTLSSYTDTYIPFFGAGGLLSEDSFFTVDNTNKTLLIDEADIEGHVGLELKNSRTANTANTESLTFQLKVDNDSLQRAMRIEASFSDIVTATADSLIRFRTRENGAFSDALLFEGHTVRVDNNLIIGNGGSPIASFDKTATGTGQLQFTRGVTNVDWTLTHGADENLELKGLNSDTDFSININDGGVQKDVFVIDSSVPSISMPNITLLDVAGDLDVGGKISFNTSTFSAVGPTDNVDVSGINTLFIDNSGNAVTIGGFAGGVDGQVLYVTLINAGANNVTIEHNEGGATQPIFLHKGSDESLNTEYGGWVFACHNGTDWHDCSHAQHV